LGEARQLEEQGVALGADVALAQGIRAGLSTQLAGLKGQSGQLLARIKELAGSEFLPSEDLELADFSSDSDTVPSAAVRSAQLGVAAANDGIRAAERGNDLSLGWSVQSRPMYMARPPRLPLTAYVGLSWTLFDPQKSSSVAAARAQSRAKSAELTAAMRASTRATGELNANLAALESSRAEIAAMRDSLEHSLEHLLPLYRDGRKSIADLAELRQKLAQTATDCRYESMRPSLSTRVGLVEARSRLTLDKYLAFGNNMMRSIIKFFAKANSPRC
jgi:hypothetical protein